MYYFAQFLYYFTELFIAAKKKDGALSLLLEVKGRRGMKCFISKNSSDYTGHKNFTIEVVEQAGEAYTEELRETETRF